MVVPTPEFRRTTMWLAVLFLTDTKYSISTGKVLEDHTFGTIHWEEASNLCY